MLRVGSNATLRLHYHSAEVVSVDAVSPVLPVVALVISLSRVLKKSARRNGFPFAWAAAFGVGSFDADSMRA